MSRPDSFALDVRVTRSDISAGCRKNSRKCALALAVSRSAREHCIPGGVWVKRSHAIIGIPNERCDCGIQIHWQAPLPRSASAFVCDFDAWRRRARPFACRLVFRRFE